MSEKQAERYAACGGKTKKETRPLGVKHQRWLPHQHGGKEIIGCKIHSLAWNNVEI